MMSGKKIVYTLATNNCIDGKYRDLSIPCIERYCEAVGAEFKIETDLHPRILNPNYFWHRLPYALDYINSGYDQVLHLDLDILISSSAGNIFQEMSNLGGDVFAIKGHQWRLNKAVRRSLLSLPIEFRTFFNCGVLGFSNTSRAVKFLEAYEELSNTGDCHLPKNRLVVSHAGLDNLGRIGYTAMNYEQPAIFASAWHSKVPVTFLTRAWNFPYSGVNKNSNVFICHYTNKKHLMGSAKDKFLKHNETY